MEADLILNIAHSAIKTGTPLLLVATGELVCERSGVLNLGQEGMMLMGAVGGFILAFTTGSLALGLIAAVLAGILMALLFGFLVLQLNANQVATGLALTIFGIGLSAFIGAGFVGNSIPGFSAIEIPLLSSLPIVGEVLFNHDLLVYLSWIICAAVIWFISKSRGGLILRAVGESPHSAHSIGLSVVQVRYLAIMFGGAMAGLGGAYLSLVYTPLWSENMSAGRGWIALALVVFASWRIQRLLLGAYLFGFASIMHLVFQGMGVKVSGNLLATLPYVATIIVLVILSSRKFRQSLSAPASLGQPFHASD